MISLFVVHSKIEERKGEIYWVGGCIYHEERVSRSDELHDKFSVQKNSNSKKEPVCGREIEQTAARGIEKIEN